MNSVTILGGSSAGAGTGQGCSSYLVKVDDTSIVLDMGPDTLQELRKHVDYRTLDAVVISHLHVDYVLDIFALRFMLSYNPIKASKRVPLFMPPNGLAFLTKAAELFATKQDDIETYFSAVFDLHEYDPTQPLQIGDATITFAPTVHLIPCWAMRVQSSNGDAMVYTADTGTDADLDELVEGAAVIIADAAAAPDAPDAVKRGIHYDAAAAAELAARAGATHLVLSHQWEELDPIANASRAREIFLGPISVAIPGLTVTW
ncbi:MAG: MBL fold metallo-hydrolase [Thermomicrobiales bacterium]|nr:MBL fold metallo-hydrolase [Thermomicrobiales bacterium]